MPRRGRHVAIRGRFLDLYRTDPDPGLHAAAAWTLRQWGHGKEVVEIDKQLSSQHESRIEAQKLPTWRVNSQGQTMVLIPGPVEFQMGSPESEPERDSDEVLHSRRIGRSFAIAAHHVTVAQFKRFNSRFTHGSMVRRAPEPDCPIIGLTWYEAAEYCNWLSKQEGIPENQWCYLPNEQRKVCKGDAARPRLSAAHGLPIADRSRMGVLLPGRGRDRLLLRTIGRTASEVCLVSP